MFISSWIFSLSPLNIKSSPNTSGNFSFCVKFKRSLGSYKFNSILVLNKSNVILSKAGDKYIAISPNFCINSHNVLVWESISLIKSLIYLSVAIVSILLFLIITNKFFKVLKACSFNFKVTGSYNISLIFSSGVLFFVLT